MILSYEDLPKYAGQFAMIDGGFDPLHIGHIRYAQEAKKLGKPLFCNIQADTYLIHKKKRPPLLPEEQRIAVIDALEAVSAVHLCKTSTHDILSRIKPAYYIKGMDWKEKGLPQEELEVCKKNGVEICYLDTKLDSSTYRVQSFVDQALKLKEGERAVKDNALSSFEELVFSQKAAGPEEYSEHYFMDTWREDKAGNNYTLEARRKIEGKNPQNIKDVFSPKRALDLGCGPGALMYLLHEIGVETWGVDFSAPARELAPQEVRDRIHVGPVTDYHDFGHDFDLVICREVVEHLTILQVRKVLQAMAKYTSKYIYLTTRFHPEPNSLLDVTDDRETDPTHITLLNKDFLRTLLVLEGFRSRPDLEAKMDWKNYGRVIVGEKMISS